MVALLRKVGVRIEFDIGELIFIEICQHDEKLYSKLNLPYLSLIFQILFLQNEKKNVKATEKYEKMPLEPKFSHKWLKVRHTIMDPGNMQEEEASTKDTTMFGTIGTDFDTVPGSSNT
ncbi:hypothetical protein PVK06_001497 [Gossypium arboreum]|uniref:Uncharacterized protein n=1 Tax=Gossypium arboreum TaxID=29729 RepID=A0ABR0R1C2_GOSAR|nr:hypothetical protein PVK06_001497 [Gossypium arboreum]